ncbi:MAG: hypothetical protein NTV86_03490 [Planctomycetota bacterium]|nr:hypothetical protein [Planctomycetota bacterium]
MKLWHTRRNVVELAVLAVAAAGWLAWANTTECQVQTLLVQARFCKGALPGPGLADRARMLAGLRWPERKGSLQIEENLAALGAPAVPTLMKALGEGVVGQEAWASHALARIGAPAVEPVGALLADPNNNFVKRLEATQILGRIGPNARAAAPLLTRVVRQDTTFLRFAAAKALASVDPPAAEKVALPIILEQLAHEGDVGLRIWAEYALFEIGPVNEPVREVIQARLARGAFSWTYARWAQTHRTGQAY